MPIDEKERKKIFFFWFGTKVENAKFNLRDLFTINSPWGLPTTEIFVAIVYPTDLCFLSLKEHVEYLSSFRVTNSAVPVGIEYCLQQREKGGKHINYLLVSLYSDLGDNN